jgi:DNA-binding transcriptional LysR family regulator
MNDNNQEDRSLDIRQLKYFLAVAKHKSFTKASQALHLSQPSISKMIKSLEDELGVTLIDRSTKQIELTDAGEIVRKQAQQIIHSIDDLAQSLYDLMHLNKGHVTLGLPPIAGTIFFAPIIEKLHRHYPGIQLELMEFGSKKVAQGIESGILDVGIAMLPVDSCKFDVIPFVSEEMRLITHRRHPLAGKSVVSLSELKDESFIFLSEEFALYERIWHECTKAGLKPKITYKSSQWDFIAELVATGLGIAIFPQSLCAKLPTERLRIIPINPAIPWNLGIIVKKHRYISYAAQTLINLIKNHRFNHN